MKQINCRYCGKAIVFGANLNWSKDVEKINAKIAMHELECENGEAIINDVPESNPLKRDRCGKMLIRTSSLNPALHIENAMVNIHNLAHIAKELEEPGIEDQCRAALDEVLKIKSLLQAKYRW